MKRKLKRLIDERFSEMREMGRQRKISKTMFKEVTSEITDVLNDCFMQNSNSDTSFEESFVKAKGLQENPTYEQKSNAEILKKAKQKY